MSGFGDTCYFPLIFRKNYGTDYEKSRNMLRIQQRLYTIKNSNRYIEDASWPEDSCSGMYVILSWEKGARTIYWASFIEFWSVSIHFSFTSPQFSK
jgi:hypothetical protein